MFPIVLVCLEGITLAHSLLQNTDVNLLTMGESPLREKGEQFQASATEGSRFSSPCLSLDELAAPTIGELKTGAAQGQR